MAPVGLCSTAGPAAVVATGADVSAAFGGVMSGTTVPVAGADGRHRAGPGGGADSPGSGGGRLPDAGLARADEDDVPGGPARHGCLPTRPCGEDDVPEAAEGTAAGNKYRSHDEQVPFSRAISTVLARGRTRGGRRGAVRGVVGAAAKGCGPRCGQGRLTAAMTALARPGTAESGRECWEITVSPSPVRASTTHAGGTTKRSEA